MDAGRWVATVEGVTPAIERLLILQERDGRRLGLEQSIARMPRELEEAAKKITAEKDALAAIAQGLKQMEVRRAELDLEMKDLEEKARKYKNQQLAVKKNDEYQAITHEIEAVEKAAGELEEQEIELMLEIDEAKAKAAIKSAEHEKSIQLHEREIAAIKEREGNLKAELTEAQADTAKAEEVSPEPFISHYKQIRERGVRFPLVVPLDVNMCGGCHLKVSGEVETIVRHQKEPAHCNNCGRMVYWE